MLRREDVLSRVVLVLVLVGCAELVACGPTARQSALRASLLSVNAAQAGFVQWDDDEQQALVARAESADAARAALVVHDKRVIPIVGAFEVTYQLLATAAIEPSDVNVLLYVHQIELLFEAIEKLTGEKLAPAPIVP